MRVVLNASARGNIWFLHRARALHVLLEKKNHETKYHKNMSTKSTSMVYF